MADKGFEINDPLLPLDVRLNVPPFLDKRMQMLPADVSVLRLNQRQVSLEEPSSGFDASVGRQGHSVIFFEQATIRDRLASRYTKDCRSHTLITLMRPRSQKSTDSRQ